MEKKIKFIVSVIIVLSMVLMFFILVTQKGSLGNEEDKVDVNIPIIESFQAERLVIPRNEYNIIQSIAGIGLDYYEGWEMVQAEVVNGSLGIIRENDDGLCDYLYEGTKCELKKKEKILEYIYIRPGMELSEKVDGDRVFYAYFTFLEDEHIVAQSFVVIREDMEGIMNDPFYGRATMNYYAIPIKEVQYKKIDGKYQNVTKEYADAWFNGNMEEYEIKKAVETAPEKSRFKITQDYSTDYAKQGKEEISKLKGISVDYEFENIKQYVEAVTDNGEVGIWKDDYLYVNIDQKTINLQGTSMICWFDSGNFEKDKYDDRVAYLKLVYRENLKVLGLALIKIEYKDDTETSYSTQIKEVSYEPIDGRSQYISEQTKEAWFERAMSEFEQEINLK